MKRCCRRLIKFFGRDKKLWKKCPECGHIYLDLYPELTVRCECEIYPLKKCGHILE